MHTSLMPRTTELNDGTEVLLPMDLNLMHVSREIYMLVGTITGLSTDELFGAMLLGAAVSARALPDVDIRVKLEEIVTYLNLMDARAKAEAEAAAAALLEAEVVL